jgi:hypothetical protein
MNTKFPVYIPVSQTMTTFRVRHVGFKCHSICLYSNDKATYPWK